MRLLVWLTVVLSGRCCGAGVAELVGAPPVTTASGTSPRTTTTTSIAPKFSPTLAEQAAVSIYLVASEVAVKIRDRIISPAIQLWKDQEAAALERKWYAKEQQQQQQSRIPVSESSSDNSPTHIMTSAVAVAKQPTNNVLSTLMAQVEESPSTNKIVTKFLSPGRLGKVTVVAWLVADALDRLGILQEDTPQILQSQLHRVWDMMETGLRQVHYRFEAAAAQTNKPPFAVGMMAGMLVSPLLTMVWRPLLAVICLAEWNSHQRIQGK